jgi:hypothetical protein
MGTGVVLTRATIVTERQFCTLVLAKPTGRANAHPRTGSAKETRLLRRFWNFVIPGRIEDANPESKDSPMCNCTSEVWSFGPSRNDEETNQPSVFSFSAAFGAK